MDSRALFISRAQKTQIFVLSPDEFLRAQNKPNGLKYVLIAGSKNNLSQRKRQNERSNKSIYKAMRQQTVEHK
jgi:hypothetical protein